MDIEWDPAFTETMKQLVEKSRPDMVADTQARFGESLAAFADTHRGESVDLVRAAFQAEYDHAITFDTDMIDTIASAVSAGRPLPEITFR
jgi:hypothetical protein